MHFTKTERWGLMIWSVVILMISFGFAQLTSFIHHDHNEKKLERYLQQLDSITRHHSKPVVPVYKFHSFNPNEVDQEELEGMGLSKKLAERWVNFRESIGGFDGLRDIQKIYGLDSTVFEKVKPHLDFPDQSDDQQSGKRQSYPSHSGQKWSTESTPTLDNTVQTKTKTKTLDRPSSVQLNSCSTDKLMALGFPDSIAHRIVYYRKKVSPYYRIEDLYRIYDIDTHTVDKLRSKIHIDESKLEKIDLNTAGKEELKEMPGIGDVYAGRIIEFREKTGGFQSLSQLKDIYGIEEELYRNISPRIKLSPAKPKKIMINTANMEELSNHPYVSWELAERILNYRKHHFPIRDLNNLLGIDSGQIKRLAPYVSYEVPAP